MLERTPQTQFERTLDSFKKLPSLVGLLDDQTWMALIATSDDPILQSLQAGNRRIADFPFVALLLVVNRWENTREAFARNPSIFDLPNRYLDSIIEKLAHDPSDRVRSGLAANPSLFGLPDIALLLASDENALVREAVATNPAVTELLGVVKTLASDPDGSVRDGLAETLALFSESEIARYFSHVEPEGEVS